jgi:hypothetical protein
MTWIKPRPQRADRSAEFAGYVPRPRAAAVAVTDTRARLVVPLPKQAPVRDAAYLRAVAALPCAHCGRPGPSQAAHADEGKGMGIKASDHDTMPLCADSPGQRGCHWIIGTSGTFTREERRALEVRYVAETKQALQGII